MKRKERVMWILPILAIIAGFGACSAQVASKNNYYPSAQEQKLDKESKQIIIEIEKAFKMIKKYYVDDVDSQAIYEGALRGMMNALEDPHSVYLDAETFKSMKKDVLRGDYGGVGLYINKPNPKSLKIDSEITDWYIQIIAPIKGTPGYNADLHAGDFITHIDGDSVAEFNSREAVEHLTGKKGTDVVVTILRGKEFTFDVTLTRAYIEVPTIESALIKDSIAYIRMSSWTKHTADDLTKAIEKFKSENYSSLILDLRENGGGLLDAAVEITNFFLSEGTIVSTRYRTQILDQKFEANTYKTKVKSDIPVVVLIDNGSASASEIFSGAMKDSGRATLIGQTSYGKGSIQVPFPLSYNDSMKITVGRYYTPSGENIDKIGIEPDIIVEKEEFSDEEIESLQKILSEKIIDNFVKEHPKSSKRENDIFIEKQKNEGCALKENVIRKLIRNKYNRKMDFPPVYDLEFDTVLQKAIEFLESNKK